MRKVDITSGWSWFRFIDLGVALGKVLTFYISLAKELKLKGRKFWGLIPSFVVLKWEKLVEGLLAPYEQG